MVTAVTHRRIVGYVRVSTERQAGEGHYSLETQEQRIREVTASWGGLVLKIFTDVESGRRDNRPEYRKMLDYVRTEDIDTVLVQYIDRFGRNPQEILSRKWELERRGVSVEASDQDIREEMMLRVQAGIAGHESKRISERVRSNMRNSAKRGIHSDPPPFGLLPVREIKDGRAVVVRWEIVEEEAEIIREMVRLSAEKNLGFKAIANSLNERGMKRGSRYWVTASIQMILQNPAIKGLMVYGRTQKKGNPPQEVIEVPGVFPPIITEEELDRLQQRMEIRRGSPRGRKHRSNYLISGTARCGHCGGPMLGKTGSQTKDSVYCSYQCSRANKAGKRVPLTMVTRPDASNLRCWSTWASTVTRHGSESCYTKQARLILSARRTSLAGLRSSSASLMPTYTRTSIS